MQKDKSFPLTLDFEGTHYQGKIMPSEELSKNVVPVYFRVSLGDTLFAYLCCSDNGWKERDNANPPSGLIKAIGDYITDFYE